MMNLQINTFSVKQGGAYCSQVIIMIKSVFSKCLTLTGVFK